MTVTSEVTVTFVTLYFFYRYNDTNRQKLRTVGQIANLSYITSKEGETMDDLFTILIILAFIISFLNKIFGKKKQQPTTRHQPTPQPKQPDWLPPWLQMDETEVQIPAEGEQEHAIIEEIEQKQPSIDSQEKLKVPPEQPIILEPKMVSEKSEPTFKPEEKSLKAIDIELSSRDELKRGIILAEILGPCRARRYLRKR